MDILNGNSRISIKNVIVLTQKDIADISEMLNPDSEIQPQNVKNGLTEY